MRASDFSGEVCRQGLLFSQLAFEGVLATALQADSQENGSVSFEMFLMYVTSRKQCLISDPSPRPEAVQQWRPATHQDADIPVMSSKLQEAFWLITERWGQKCMLISMATNFRLVETNNCGAQAGRDSIFIDFLSKSY